MANVASLLVPTILLGIAIYGAMHGVDLYDALLCGAREGLQILLRIFPALIILLSAVGMLRASGALALLQEPLAAILEAIGIPSETVSRL